MTERFAPTLVTQCVGGGTTGRHLSYSEDKGEVHPRSLSFNYSTDKAFVLGLPSNPFALSSKISELFGRDVSAEVSSSAISADRFLIQPGEYGVFYRQAMKIECQATMTAQIGEGDATLSVDLGTVTLTDWAYKVDFAHGDMCAPPTHLLPAAIY